MEENYICKFCGKVCKNANSLRNHERLCKKNPDKQNSNFIKYNNEIRTGLRKSSNFGKTKETNDDIRIATEKRKQRYELGEIKPSFLGKHHTEETKQHLRNIERRNCRKNFHCGWYKGYWCDSSWELAFLYYCLEHNIKIERNHERFEYVFNGKVKGYYPDFKIENNYVEIKGYKNEFFQEKCNQFPKDKKLLIIDRTNIKKYLDFTILNNGKEFWKKLYNMGVMV